MISITISGRAYAAIAETMPPGAVTGQEIVPDGEYRIWLPLEFVTRLKALREPGETFSDVILRVRTTTPDGISAVYDHPA